MFWVDILQYLGEYDNGVLTLLQAAEYFPEEYEIEYRLAGLNFMLKENEKGSFHLSNGLRLNFKNKTILEELFPKVWEMKKVQTYISKHKE